MIRMMDKHDASQQSVCSTYVPLSPTEHTEFMMMKAWKAGTAGAKWRHHLPLCRHHLHIPERVPRCGSPRAQGPAVVHVLLLPPPLLLLLPVPRPAPAQARAHACAPTFAPFCTGLLHTGERH